MLAALYSMSFCKALRGVLCRLVPRYAIEADYRDNCCVLMMADGKV